MELKQYLQSTEAKKAFAKIRMEAESGESFNKAWKFYLMKRKNLKMGVTNPISLLPGATIEKIESNIKLREIYSRVTKLLDTPILVRALDTSSDTAHAHLRDLAKLDESQTITTQNMVANTIYKLTSFNEIDGVLSEAYINYLYEELPGKVLEAVEEAIVWGSVPSEGLETSNSFISPIDTDVLTTTYAPSSGETAYESVAKMVNEVERDGNALEDIVVISTSAYADTVTSSLSSATSPFVGTSTNLGRAFGVSWIIMDKKFSSSTTNVLVGPISKYQVGLATDNVEEILTKFDIDKNRRILESQITLCGQLVKGWLKL